MWDEVIMNLDYDNIQANSFTLHGLVSDTDGVTFPGTRWAGTPVYIF